MQGRRGLRSLPPLRQSEREGEAAAFGGRPDDTVPSHGRLVPRSLLRRAPGEPAAATGGAREPPAHEEGRLALQEVRAPGSGTFGHHARTEVRQAQHADERSLGSAAIPTRRLQLVRGAVARTGERICYDYSRGILKHYGRCHCALSNVLSWRMQWTARIRDRAVYR